MNNLLLIIIIAIIVILFVINRHNRVSYKKEDPVLDDIHPEVVSRVNNGKVNVWMFCNDRDLNFKMNWRYPQLKYNYSYPFENLCVEAFIKNMTKHNVNVIVLTDKNIKMYVPDFPLKMKQNGYQDKKVMDLLGAYILERYGGLWVSPYTITLNKNYSQLFEEIQHNDIVTFGTSPNIINCDPYNGSYKAVNNNIIGCKRYSPVIKKYKELMKSYISSNQYKYLYNHVNNDPEPLGEAIVATKPIHIHHCCKTDGSYNINSRKIHMDEFLGKMPLQFLDPPKLMFVSLPYHELETNTTHLWIKSTPINELLNSGISIVEVLKKQL